jgi:hypothetical protein
LLARKLKLKSGFSGNMQLFYWLNCYSETNCLFSVYFADHTEG